MKGSLRSALALLALGWLVFMYLAGELPRHGHFNAARIDGGVLEFAPEQVQKITLDAGGVRYEAKRAAAAAWRFTPVPTAPLRLADRLDAALRYLHVSPPVRSLGFPAQTDPVLDASGLAHPTAVLVVTSDNSRQQRFSLGETAPDGILRYLRADDSGELYLVSGFVAGAWDELAKAWKSGPRRAYKR